MEIENSNNEIKVCPECDKPIYFKDRAGHYHCYYCNTLTDNPSQRKRLREYDNRKDKRSIGDEDIITRNQLLTKLRQIKGEKKVMNQALISFLYLTAARIEEVVGLVNQVTRKLIIQPVKKNQITFKELDDKQYMVIERMPVYKRKLKDGNIPRRNVPIFIDNDLEFVDYIKQYISVKEDDEILFKMSYQRAWQISNEIILDEVSQDRAFNHYWRHLRLTHLAEDYGLQDLDLQQFVGWANTLMAAKYTHLNWQALAGKMSKVRINR